MNRNFLHDWLGWAIAPFFLYSPVASAQIVPDGSLGMERSIVSSPAPNVTRIDGGATRGTNLFHSFQEFSIPMGRAALFDNAARIENIFTRVTGGNISNIDGLLQANGNASVFLLNPNGIVFGPEARLNIGGSFFATTAESLNFDSGSTFGAIAPNAPLLTVNTPIGLQFGENPGAIVHRSQALRPASLPPALPLPPNAGLEVAPGRTLASIGGDVFLESGNLTALQGEAHLGSVAGPGIVAFALTPAGANFDYERIADFGTIELSGTATVNVSGSSGGTISLRGGDIIVREDASLLAVTFENEDGRGIEVVGDRFLVQESSLISTLNFGTGSGGDLTIRTNESVTFSGPGFPALQELLVAFLNGEVDGNNLDFGIIIGGQGNGRAGTATIETGKLVVRDGAFLSTSTFGSGTGGDAIVRAEAIALDAAFLLSSTALGTAGDSGNIILETQTLRLVNGGSILATTLGSGAGGNIVVREADVVEISGRPDGALFPSEIVTSSLLGSGTAGSIEIEARRIAVSDGAAVIGRSGSILGTTTISEGGPGNSVFLKASESIEVRGTSADGRFPSSVGAESLSDAPAGDVVIETDRLTIGDGAFLTVNGGSTPTAIAAGSVGGAGDAGTLQIVANIVRLEEGGALLASTVSGRGGNISIQAEDLQLRGRSSISTNGGNSNGGNIAIATETLVALENSDITANAGAGFGGRVAIEATGIFGTQFRSALTPDSDITATSVLGADFGGEVEINELEVDPGSTLIDLPQEPIELTTLFARDPCHHFFQNGEFYFVGRGGIPLDPNELLLPYATTSDRLWIVAGETSDERLAKLPLQREEISEASGWERDGDGNVVALLSADGAFSRESRCTGDLRSAIAAPTSKKLF